MKYPVFSNVKFFSQTKARYQFILLGSEGKIRESFHLYGFIYLQYQLEKNKEKTAFIYRLIFYTVPDCNVCSETMDASRRKQRTISKTVSYS